VEFQKPREIAVRVAQRWEKSAAYLENLLENELAGATLSPADRRLVQELSYGIVRWRGTLDWLIARRTAGRTQKLLLQIVLRLGLYQLLWLDRIPAHAAVNESVELVRLFGCASQAGFINAILRGYARERDATKRLLAELKLDQPPLGYSHPDWLCERWKKRWTPEKLRQLLEWNNTPPPTFARANTLKTDGPRLTALWEKEGVSFTPRSWDWTKNGLVYELNEHPALSDLESFRQGLFYIQDPGTLLAVHELNPHPGDIVLDLCSAPGGKTTLIAQQMQNRGRIIAQDRFLERLWLVRENCTRLGVTCVETSRGEGVVFPDLNVHFDRILVDAPCSNTGVMRRRVDVRWRVGPEQIERLRGLQLELLREVAPLLKPGGTLVYSTCSLEPEENSQVVKQVRAEFPALDLQAERELLPFLDGVDGAYVARFTRQLPGSFSEAGSI
jgi:16S rRNA (cytosine967-C5)-methyltransferase